MKRIIIPLLLLSSLLYAEKGPWEVGIAGGGTFLNDILGDYWNSHLTGGIEILYPFHQRVPVLLSMQVSHHDQESSPPPRDGFHSTEYELLMYHFALLWQFMIIDEKPVQPYVGAGLSNTIFVTYTEWPPPSNSDESEYGVTVTGGVQYSPNEKIRFFSDYRFNTAFTAPYRLHFGAARIGIRFCLPRIGGNDA